jgi:hypothetical protein
MGQLGSDSNSFPNPPSPYRQGSVLKACYQRQRGYDTRLHGSFVQQAFVSLVQRGGVDADERIPCDMLSNDSE